MELAKQYIEEFTAWLNNFKNIEGIYKPQDYKGTYFTLRNVIAICLIREGRRSL